MDIKEATQIVDNPPPINWEWLAGFFQAEGCITSNRGQPRLCISQKETSILTSISRFIEQELDCQMSLHTTSGKTTNLVTNRQHSIAQFLTHTSPYLRGSKRYVEVIPTQPFGWDFVTGFWEGDGTIIHDRTYLIKFTQKDPDVLQSIKEFIGRGSLLQRPVHTNFKDSTLYKLTISEPHNKLEVVRRLLEHARLREKRAKLVSIIMHEDGHEL